MPVTTYDEKTATHLLLQLRTDLLRLKVRNSAKSKMLMLLDSILSDPINYMSLRQPYMDRAGLLGERK